MKGEMPQNAAKRLFKLRLNCPIRKLLRISSTVTERLVRLPSSRHGQKRRKICQAITRDALISGACEHMKCTSPRLRQSWKVAD